MVSLRYSGVQVHGVLYFMLTLSYFMLTQKKGKHMWVGVGRKCTQLEKVGIG